MGIFTGLIAEVGRVRRRELRGDGAFMIIQAKSVLEGTRIGDSISINGVDLTVIQMGADFFSADASIETLKRSTLGELREGSQVNLERALALGERLGGHIVQGHIDGTIELVSAKPEGNAHRLRFRFPGELGRYIAMKGSVAVDGISLTVAGLSDHWFEVVVIPHTWRETTLADLKPGSRSNIEVDVLAKYVDRLIASRGDSSGSAGRLTLDYLVEQGF